jgi:hypothetical protein
MIEGMTEHCFYFKMARVWSLGLQTFDSNEALGRKPIMRTARTCEHFQVFSLRHAQTLTIN